MKKIFFSLLLALLATNLSAKTIHWITFIDTTDPNVGAIDINTRSILYTKWINVINAALAPAGYNSDIQDYYGYMTSPENCKAAVESLQCEEDDIVVFYYIGHGARSQHDNSKYPQMCLAQNYEDKFVPLQWVSETLKSKKTRLNVVIGMCCNSYAQISAKSSPTFSVNYGKAYMSDNQITNIQKLFLGNRGNIIVTSSKPGQTSGACPSPLGMTDYFTYNFIAYFYEMIAEQSVSTWSKYLNNVQEIVDVVSSSDGRQQTPIFDIDINNNAKPKDVKPDKPVKPETRKTETQDDQSNNTLGNKLTKYFDYLVNTNVSEMNRLNEAEEAMSLFTSDATVKILAQDTDTVIDKESYSDFLDRISTSRLLLKVIWVDGTIDKNGKICELKVREFYKK